jgi:hypothetical protein
MKFKVRKGFAVHAERIVERWDGHKKIKDGKVDTFFENEEVELTEADARKHLHKLEPRDKDARALLECEYEKGRIISAARFASLCAPQSAGASTSDDGLQQKKDRGEKEMKAVGVLIIIAIVTG